MRPDDANGRLPTAARPLRVLLIAGSDRRLGLNRDVTRRPVESEGAKLRK